MKYITIRDSVEQASFVSDQQPHGKTFRVIQGGYVPVSHKAQTIDPTIDGSIDVQLGSVRKSTRYVVWLAESDADNYGILAELEYYYKLNSANSSPSNNVFIVDHYGNTAEGYLLGDFSPTPVTTMLVGTNAYYTVELQFMEKAAIA